MSQLWRTWMKDLTLKSVKPAMLTILKRWEESIHSVPTGLNFLVSQSVLNVGSQVHHQVEVSIPAVHLRKAQQRVHLQVLLPVDLLLLHQVEALLAVPAILPQPVPLSVQVVFRLVVQAHRQVVFHLAVRVHHQVVFHLPVRVVLHLVCLVHPPVLPHP